MFCPACQSQWPEEWKVCPKDATNLLRSAHIGKYGIEGLLGVGGMGAVYRATNPDTKGAVAIKVMNPAVAASESLRARFQREAGVVAKLRTSHVTKVYDFGQEPDGTLYLVMELLDGHTLREEITPAPDYMDLARVQLVFDGALKGLAAAHKAGIVHRDLKPDNIYIADTDDGEVPKLLDFGIARVRSKEDGLTRTGSLMGTASYMAPEQVAGQQGAMGPWTDIYAMGAILYECLAGSAAFGGDTVTEVLQRVMRSDSVPLASVRAGLPDKVYALVDKWMSPDATKRPQDADAARAQLLSAGLVAPGTAVPPASKTRPGTPPPIASDSAPGLAQTVGAAGAPPPPIRHTPADRSGPVVVPTPVPTPVPPQHTTGGAGQISAPPAKRAMWPFAVGGLVVVGGIALVAVKMSGGAVSAPAKSDAAVTPPPVDAARPAPDAAIAVVVDAAPAVDAMRSKMIHFEASDVDVGEDKAAHPDALAKAHVHVDEFWLDPAELTLGELRAALKSKAGGIPTDKPDVPARRIDFATAEAACKALGKRLPTEIEWEVAALTTPNDAKVALPAKQMDLAPSKHEGDCSAAGLCDMLGSVAEWTSTPDNAKHIVRGASYQVSPTAGWEATIHARVAQGKGDDDIGVRCAASRQP